MKKIITMLMLVACALALVACGSTEEKVKKETGSKSVKANDYVTVDGIFLDSSYVDDESAALKMLYVFCTVNAKDKNLKVDSAYLKMTVGESNTYESEFYKGKCEYAPSYYYSSFIKDIYIGEEIKVAFTYKVPEGDLVEGRVITFEDFDLPVDGLKIFTDDIIICDSVEKLCEQADPTGYAEIIDKHSPADEATVATICNMLNGYYWEFYMSAGTTVQPCELEFSAPNNFEMRTSFGSNVGTYEVKKAFIYVTYSSNQQTYKIPYEVVNGELHLSCEEAFSIYE